MWPFSNRKKKLVDRGTVAVAVNYADPQLPCHRCANGASGEPFPGMPSGEAPCAVCIRNQARDDWYRKNDRLAAYMSERFGIPEGATVDMYVAMDRAIIDARGRMTHHPWHDVASFRLSCEKMV